MKKETWTVAPLLALAAGCTSPGWRTNDALDAQMIEMQFDSWGRASEIEYHVDPQAVPAEVRAAMDALHPGGKTTGAEKEYVGKALYWELTKEIDGRDVEAMFLPDGTLHSEEIEVDANAVPAAVKDAVAARMEGEIAKWEEIHDAERALVEYHAKLTANGMKYKLRVATSGEILGIVREVLAEIEVPVE